MGKRDGKTFTSTLPSRLPARVKEFNAKTLEAGVTACWQMVRNSHVRAREIEKFQEFDIEHKDTEEQRFYIHDTRWQEKLE